MQYASTLFNDEQRQRVTQAVRDAELKTSAEIIPVVATASGRYDRPEDVVGLWLGAAMMLVAWYVVPAAEPHPGSWGGIPEFVQPLALVVSLLVGFVLGAVLASNIGWLRRLFTPRKQMVDEVAARAREMFFDKRVHHTEGASGVLVFVSLFERSAAILADNAILTKLGADEIDRICQQLTTGIQSTSITDAICATIQQLGEKLGPVLPRAADDVNELPDTLITID